MSQRSRLDSDRSDNNSRARKELRILVNREIQQMLKVECHSFIKRQSWSHAKGIPSSL
jgi:hypothetical protein